VELVESFIARRIGDQWNDCIMVFRRDRDAAPIAQRVVDHLPGARNIRRSLDGEVEQREELTEDMLLLAEARKNLAAREAEIAKLTAALRSAETRFAAAGAKWVGFDC
jgi:hypothetical protein